MGEGAQPGTASKEIKKGQHVGGFCHLMGADMNRRLVRRSWGTLVGLPELGIR